MDIDATITAEAYSWRDDWYDTDDDMISVVERAWQRDRPRQQVEAERIAREAGK